MEKVILITGASSGMGRATAILLAEEGHKVYGGARRFDLLQELTPYGIIPVEMDVTCQEDDERVVNQIIENEGRIDVLINNAGFGLYGPVEDVPLEDARYQFVKGSVICQLNGRIICPLFGENIRLAPA